jgi:hypothetical protein
MDDLRLLLQVIPNFSSPASTWVNRITLLTKHITQKDSLVVIDVVLSKLPEHLYQQLASRKFEDLDSLLQQVLYLERGSITPLTNRLINDKWELQAHQKASHLYTELLDLSKQVLTKQSPDDITNFAKMKLMSALPPMAQTLISFAPPSKSFDEILCQVDDFITQQNASKPQQCCSASINPSAAAISNAQVVKDLTNRINGLEAKNNDPPADETVEGHLEQLLCRVQALETRQKMLDTDRPRRNSVGNNDSTLCWYHQRFGREARRCLPPCRWNSFSKN